VFKQLISVLACQRRTGELAVPRGKARHRPCPPLPDSGDDLVHGPKCPRFGRVILPLPLDPQEGMPALGLGRRE